MAEVVLHAVSKRFGATQAVGEFSLRVADGSFVVLLGPSGAGKTTVLRLIAGLERADTGRIEIGGHDMTQAAVAERDVAFVFQQYSLYPHLSVFDNLAFPLRSPARRLPEAQIARRVGEIAEKLRISEKLRERVTRLSGGQMQRVAIGRALVRAPAIFLMDEPLSSLDAKLRADLRIELKRIQHELGATILYVTHDQIEAMTLASQVGVIEHGRLVQIGTPRQIYENPANAYVAARLGSPPINFFPPALFADAPMPPQTHLVGARTEHLLIRKSAGGRGRVSRVEHLGDQDHLHLRVNGHHLVTLSDPEAGLEAGDEVAIALHNPLFFDAGGKRVNDHAS